MFISWQVKCERTIAMHSLILATHGFKRGRLESIVCVWCRRGCAYVLLILQFRLCPYSSNISTRIHIRIYIYSHTYVNIHFNIQALALPTTLHTHSPPAPPRSHNPAARAPSPANAGAAKEDQALAKNHFTTRPTQFAAGGGKEEGACSQPSVLFESGLAKPNFTPPTQFTAQFTAEGGHEEDACTQALVLSESGLANSHCTTPPTQFPTPFPGRRAESRALASGLLLASDLGLENAPFRQHPDTWRRSVAMWQERFQLPLRFVD